MLRVGHGFGYDPLELFVFKAVAKVEQIFSVTFAPLQFKTAAISTSLDSTCFSLAKT